MTPDRSARRLMSLLATGTFLVVTLVFAVPTVVTALKLLHGGLSPSERKDAVMAVGLCGVCTLIAFVGFIQYARIATGRKTIIWSWDDNVATTIDGKTDEERQ